MREIQSASGDQSICQIYRVVVQSVDFRSLVLYRGYVHDFEGGTMNDFALTVLTLAGSRLLRQREGHRA